MAKKRNDTPSKELLEAPKKATSSGIKFLDSCYKIFNFLNFIADTILNIDYSALLLQEALDDKPISKHLKPVDVAKEKPGLRTKFLRKNRQQLLEMALCRLVDNYTTYLSEIMREILHSKPEILRSQEQVRVEYILQFDSMDGLITDLIDRKISDLSYKGFSDLRKWVTDRLGIDLLDSERQEKVIIEALETRNIIVHNRGLVNDKYLKNVPNTKLLKGDLRDLHVDYFQDVTESLISHVISIDKKLSNKFKLPLEIVYQEKEEEKKNKKKEKKEKKKSHK